MGAPGQGLSAGRPLGLVNEQAGIVDLDHGGARPRRGDDVFEGFERLDHLARDGPRISPVAGVVGRLTTARLDSRR